MPTTNTNFSTLISAIDTKAQSLAASTTDPKDLVFLGKAVEALNVADTVSGVIDEGDTQVARVTAEGNTQVAAVAAQGANFARKDQNLSDLTDTAAALTNLGAADNNLSNLGNAATARSNLGITAITSTTPSDGQVLTYDAVTSAYVNRDASGGGGGAIDLGHAIDHLSLEEVAALAQSAYSSDLRLMDAGTHSIQFNQNQFGVHGMATSNADNNSRAVALPFQVDQSTGAITKGTMFSASNSSGNAVSTTIAGDFGIGVGGIIGRQHWSQGSYVIVSYILKYKSNNTGEAYGRQGGDYNTSQWAHPQVGWCGVLGNPVRADDYSQTTGIVGFNGYGGSNGGIAADVVLDVNIGAAAGNSPSVANSGQGTNWSTNDSDTSTSACLIADYHYTDTFDRIWFAVARNDSMDHYRIFSSTDNNNITRTTTPVDMPGMSMYDRSSGHVLAFTNGYHALYDMYSGHYHLYNASHSKVGDGSLGVLNAGASAGGRWSTRRIGDNLFLVTGRYNGNAQIVNITVNTTTNKLEANVLGTLSNVGQSFHNTAAYLSGSNNEYLVLDHGLYNVSVYDIGTHLDLSAY